MGFFVLVTKGEIDQARVRMAPTDRKVLMAIKRAQPGRVVSQPQPPDKGLQDPCWIWMGARKDGYGRVRVGKLTRVLHRWFYELLRGQVPSRVELHHKCERRACFNPDHLEPMLHASHRGRHYQRP